jgi:hypothetical protein
VTSVAHSLLDYAASAPRHRVRHALAEADYRRVLDVVQVAAVLGHGRAGSAKLRKALARHEPRLARSRSDLERRSGPWANGPGCRFRRSITASAG